MSIRDRILATLAPAPHPIEVEGWGTVYVRTLTAGDIVEQQEDAAVAQKLIDNGHANGEERPALARAIARVLANEDGTKVFDAHKKEDIELILQIPWPKLRQVMEAGNRLNGITKDEDNKSPKVAESPAQDASSTALH